MTEGLTMPGRSGWRRRAGHLASFALATAFGAGVVAGAVVVVGVVVGSSTGFTSAAAAEIDPRDAEFLDSVNRIIVESGAQPGAQTRQACDRIVTTAVNMDAVIQSAMGPMWVRMSPHQRAAFRAAARRWAVRDCVRQNQDNEGTPLELLGLKEGGSGDHLLATRSSRPAHTIIWRLPGVGKARAMDVVTDGRSAVLSFRNETKALLGRNNDDIDAVTEMLGR
jgi:ABC-type transporter MlaC component